MGKTLLELQKELSALTDVELKWSESQRLQESRKLTYGLLAAQQETNNLLKTLDNRLCKVLQFMREDSESAKEADWVRFEEGIQILTKNKMKATNTIPEQVEPEQPVLPTRPPLPERPEWAVDLRDKILDLKDLLKKVYKVEGTVTNTWVRAKIITTFDEMGMEAPSTTSIGMLANTDDSSFFRWERNAEYVGLGKEGGPEYEAAWRPKLRDGKKWKLLRVALNSSIDTLVALNSNIDTLVTLGVSVPEILSEVQDG